jgi:hypothetical protein
MNRASGQGVYDAAMNPAQQRQVAALADYRRLARLRCDNGYTSYIEVLDAERSLFEAQMAYTQQQDVVLTSLIAICKAMGAGSTRGVAVGRTPDGSCKAAVCQESPTREEGAVPKPRLQHRFTEPME